PQAGRLDGVTLSPLCPLWERGPGVRGRVNDKEFWDLIDWANAQGDHPDERQDAIEDALAELPAEQIEDFYLVYDRFVTAAWTRAVTVLTYLVNCYGNRSGYEYLLGFIYWLIDAGPVVYQAALTDPERLADVEEDPPWDSEGYWRNACWAWQIATGKDEMAF